jgi:tight adherence protein C
MLVLAYSLFFISMLAAVYFLLRSIYIKDIQTHDRLNKIKKNRIQLQEEKEETLYFRLIKPAMKTLGDNLKQITPREIAINFEKLIIEAGKPFNFSLNDWLILELTLIVLIPILTIWLMISYGAGPSAITFVVIIELAVAVIIPRYVLMSKVTQRRLQIIVKLPDVIDLLTVTVEAGLGFDAAIAKVCEKFQGPIGEEFDLVLKKIKVGKKRKDALKELIKRVNVEDVSLFAGAVVQAEELGISIASVLRTLSDQMRDRARQRIREKAQKAPIKMLLPMVIFFIPCIFIIIITPIVIGAMKVL